MDLACLKAFQMFPATFGPTEVLSEMLAPSLPGYHLCHQAIFPYKQDYLSSPYFRPVISSYHLAGL